MNDVVSDFLKISVSQLPARLVRSGGFEIFRPDEHLFGRGCLKFGAFTCSFSALPTR